MFTEVKIEICGFSSDNRKLICLTIQHLHMLNFCKLHKTTSKIPLDTINTQLALTCTAFHETHSSWFKIEAGVRQGCVIAPDSFATGMDWLLDRIVESCSIGVAFGQSSFTDLDFGDDVSLLAELLELLVPILETIASEAPSLGFEVSWQKTKVQALGCREDMPLTIKVQGQDVMVVEEFVYLGSLIHSSTGSTCDISRRSAITRAATQSLEN